MRSPHRAHTGFAASKMAVTNGFGGRNMPSCYCDGRQPFSYPLRQSLPYMKLVIDTSRLRRQSAYGRHATRCHVCEPVAIGGEADSLCSLRVFRILTLSGHHLGRPSSAVWNGCSASIASTGCVLTSHLKNRRTIHTRRRGWHRVARLVH
jgi:hypothetical protein